MCRQVTCKVCKKATWAGCGAHVEQVLGGVPTSQRCQCRSGGATARAKTPAATASAAPQREGWLQRRRSGR